MENFGANVASCDEDLAIRFANRKALEIITPEETSKTASILKGTREIIEATVEISESHKFNMEFFQNE